jgi:hypothetical protein
MRFEPAGDLVELFELLVRDAHFAALPSPDDRDRKAERGGEALFQRARIGVALDRRAIGMRLRVLRHAGQLFDVADIEPLRHRFARERDRIRRGQHRARRAGGQAPVTHHLLNFRRQIEQAQEIGDVRPALADDVGDILLRAAELADQRLIALRFFERVEIGPLHVLDDADFQHFDFVEFTDHAGQRMHAGALRRAPAAFAGDDLVLARLTQRRAHQDRLQHAMRLDRIGQLVQLGVGEMPARLVRVRRDLLDRNEFHAGLGGAFSVYGRSSRRRRRRRFRARLDRRRRRIGLRYGVQVGRGRGGGALPRRFGRRRRRRRGLTHIGGERFAQQRRKATA